MTNDAGKSDSSVLPGKPPNKAGQSATEVVAVTATIGRPDVMPIKHQKRFTVFR